MRCLCCTSIGLVPLQKAEAQTGWASGVPLQGPHNSIGMAKADRELGSCHTLIRRQSIDMDSGLASNTGHERMQLDSYLRRTALLIYQCLLPPKVLLSGEIHEVMVRTPVMQVAGRMQRHTPYRLCTYDSPAIGARSWSEI